jgi:hypothetical protein
MPENARKGKENKTKRRLKRVIDSMTRTKKKSIRRILK